MKSVFFIISILLFTSLTIFSQSPVIKYQSYKLTAEEKFNREEFPLLQDFESHQSSSTKTTINKIVQENGYVLVEKLQQNWSEFYMAWVYVTLDLYSYDENANLIEWSYKFWDGIIWIHPEKFLYVYDTSNNLIESYHQINNGGTWENWDRYVYTYDVNNNLIEKLSETWYQEDWVAQTRLTCTYDGSNNLLIELNQGADLSGWNNVSRYVYSYDVNNNRLEKLYQLWNVSDWVDQSVHHYSYDGNNNLILDLRQYWNSSSWVNSWKMESTYTAYNKVSQETEYDWYSVAWENDVRRSYVYDGNNNLTMLTEAEWDDPFWVNLWRHIFEYDGSNKLTVRTEQEWYDEQWENDLRYLSSYDENNNRIEEMRQIWILTAWEDQVRRTFKYLPAFNVAPIAVDDYLIVEKDSTTIIQVLTNDSDLNGDDLTIVEVTDPLNCTADIMEGDTTISVTPALGFVGTVYFDYVISDGRGAFDTARVNIDVVMVVMATAGNLNLDITDFGTTSSSIFVNSLNKQSFSSTLIDVQVLIDTVLHTSTGDLIFTLTHNALTDTIVYESGGTGDNFINTVLSDDAETPIASASSPFTGNYKPYQPLSIFAGSDPNGEWVLEIYDGATDNTGTLEAWGLALSYQTTTGNTSNDNTQPTTYKLENNYPNPFNPSTTIKYQIPELSFISLKVFDLLGNEISILVNEEKPAGNYEVEFDAAGLSSGIYFYRIQAGSFVQTRKMILLR